MRSTRGLCKVTALAMLAMGGMLGGLLALTGCQEPAKTMSAQRVAGMPATRPARINHIALFKLKNPAQADELIADCDARLGTLPQIVSYFCGRHVDTGRGERVDGNYDVGFYVGFDSEADYNAYVAHPEHTALVAKWQPRWEWIHVYDVLDATP